tara:strand:- start:2916 stop:4862 length:1947 start_codon:yes stop_codon:yes gene_type:complete
VKKLNSFITEKSAAQEEAERVGLKYVGFGRYADPRSGKVVAKSDERGELEMLGMDQPEGGQPEQGSKETMAIGGARAAEPTGESQGTPGEGIGAPPAPVEMDWEPGPDGDTCVGGQPPEEVPVDSFVGKTNNTKWDAGPDGSTNGAGKIAVKEEDEKQGSIPLGQAGYKEKEATNKAQQRMRKIMGKKPATAGTNRDAQDALNKMRANPEQQSVFGRQLASMMKIANRQAAPDPMATNIKPPNRSDKERNERNKEADMWKKATELPAIQKDSDLVTQMNKEIQPMLQDPNYNMDVDFDDDENYLDEGAFGSVYLGDDGNVIKKGKIGPDELKALAAMKDNPRFPTLINAKFDAPFKQHSSEYNNPRGISGNARGKGESAYWDPEEQSEFDDRYPGAEGTYAMTQAKGSQLANVLGDMDEETRDKALRNFWRARGDLHKAGFSHNDMHGGNIFVDDDGEVNIIDLGLAKDNPRSALMEALGGMDYEQGEDYQLTSEVSGDEIPERLRETFDTNRSKVEEMIMDSMPGEASEYNDYDEDRDYSPTFERATDALQDMLRGGIRMHSEDLAQLGYDLPFLQDDNNVRKLIKTLYDEVGQSELADRMSDAYSRRRADSDVIRKANEIRSRRGEKPINVTNPNVVPPENLDFDD